MKERKEDKVKAHVVEQYTYRFWDHWIADGRVPHLFVADVSSGACRDLFEGTPYELVRADPDQHVYDISPDGRFIAFGYDPAPDKKLDDEFDIVELDLSARRFHNLTRRRSPLWRNIFAVSWRKSSRACSNRAGLKHYSSKAAQPPPRCWSE